jgi:undecaprenyl-phosphate 4-deoxy-4-formamido-L-arabinose transferase
VLEAAVDETLRAAGLKYELLLVDDASGDGSWSVINALARKNSAVKGISHRRNFGQDNAIMTGLRYTTGATVVVMDDDLQHAPADILKLRTELLRNGADVVYAHFRRKNRAFWKDLGRQFYARLAAWLIDKPPHIYISSFKIIRREVVQLITTFDGPHPCVDGLLFQVTNRFSWVEVDLWNRLAGQSTYTLGKSVEIIGRLAFSFSVKPLRLATWAGLLVCFFGFIGAMLVIAYRLAHSTEFDAQAAGWASLITMILFLGGIQMLVFGILGEYVGRTHVKVNRLPQAVIAETVSIDVVGEPMSGPHPSEADPRLPGRTAERLRTDHPSQDADAATGYQGTG